MSDAWSAAADLGWLADERRAGLREAGDDDHFYGAWKGGSKASGGRPMTKAEQAAAKEPKAKAGKAAPAKAKPTAKAKAQPPVIAVLDANADDNQFPAPERSYLYSARHRQRADAAKAPDPEAAARAVTEHGVRLAMKPQDTEHGVLIDAQGNVLWEQKGQGPSVDSQGRMFAGAVNLDREQRRMMEGSHFVHNHPSGTSLSYGDVWVAATNDAASVSAFGTTADLQRTRFTMHRPEHGWLPRARLRAGDVQPGDVPPLSTWTDLDAAWPAMWARSEAAARAAIPMPSSLSEYAAWNRRIVEAAKRNAMRELADWFGARYEEGSW